MQIDPRLAPPTPTAAPVKRIRRAAPPPTAPAAAPDNVSISSEARALAASRRTVEAAPDVRQDRVAELKRRIASGEYEVPADVLARALIKRDFS